MGSWFVVDKKGLAKIFEKRPKVFAIFELVQNSWDTDATKVEVSLEPVPGRPVAKLSVVDDAPDGFTDLSHAFTLFAESAKKEDPEKRGRFNIGEKLVLALCEEATIRSTTGTVHFDADGRRVGRAKTASGSTFTALIRMTRSELEEVARDILRLIPPPRIETWFNGSILPMRRALAQFAAKLPTLRADEDGNLTHTTRKTTIAIYEPNLGEAASIYEMGIPVVETGDRYHVDVGQKVPLTLDRDNVRPSYLRQLRALVAEAVAKEIGFDQEKAREPWVADALASREISTETVRAIITARFGERAAIFDPSDLEANNRFIAHGGIVVPGGALSKEAWENVRRAEALKRSGAIMPTPRPYSDDPAAPPVEVVPEDQWTVEQRGVARLAKDLAANLMGVELHVTLVKVGEGFRACYQRMGPSLGMLDFNLQALRTAWFKGPMEDILALIIHEFGHHSESNHLDERYHRALSSLAGSLAVLALDRPDMLRSVR